jgi:hypothetical protein
VIRFLDAYGSAWRVLELSPTSLADVPGSLYFFSRGSTLRLLQYPADWDTLDWAQLDGLRTKAEVLSRDAILPGAVEPQAEPVRGEGRSSWQGLV